MDLRAWLTSAGLKGQGLDNTLSKLSSGDVYTVEELYEFASITEDFDTLFPVGLTRRKIMAALDTGPKAPEKAGNPMVTMHDAASTQPTKIDSAQELPEGKT